jgi:bifunctional non-homologous end joining protein LigD
MALKKERKMNKLLKKGRKTAQPDFVPPMLATLTDEYFSNNDWIYEHKFDGVRCLVFKKNGKVRLLSRNRHLMNSEYPEIAEAFEKQKADNIILDGEIVAVEKGLSDFELLQSRINLKDLKRIKAKITQVPIALCIFDIIYCDGYDVRHLPLLERKQILKKLLKYNKLLLFTEHVVGKGIPFFHKACKMHWEGVIAKKADSIYEGRRSKNWLKFKCIMQQELVIGGFTAPRGSRTDFGALLVGYYDKGKFKYAGKVGTGYSHETLRMLGKKMRALEIKTCPFTNYDESTKDVHWIKPHLVAEFGFAQWTRGGKLRVGRYKGLRDDKAAKDVVKEVPKAIPGLPK